MARSAISRANQASLAAPLLANRVAVREHRRWIAARTTRSGSGTRSAVPMIEETTLMRPSVYRRGNGSAGSAPARPHLANGGGTHAKHPTSAGRFTKYVLDQARFRDWVPAPS